MAAFSLSDPILDALRRAHPAGAERSADEASAVALLERIIATGQAADAEHTGSYPGAGPLRPQGQAHLRRIAIGSVAAAVVAGAVVTGLGVALSGGRPRGAGALNALTLHTVAQRTKAALTAAVAQDVEYSVTTTTRPQTTAAPARTIYEWTNGAQTNIELVNPTGAPIDDVWFSGSPSAPTGTTEVLYPVHAWWTKTVPITATQLVDLTGHAIAARIQSWVRAGQLSIVGTPLIDGHKTIEVAGNALTIEDAAQTRPVSTAATRGLNLTMWLDPSTYLPVQLTTTYDTPTDAGRITSTTSSVHWLPASAANLAKVQGQVPNGFTHTTRQPTIATASLPTPAP